jgi:hypothetical protein
MTTLLLRNLISQSPLRRIFPVIFLVLGLFALSSTARAVDRPPDGGYSNGTTVEGTAHFSTSQAAKPTRLSVLMRSKATLPAALTRPAVLLRSNLARPTDRQFKLSCGNLSRGKTARAAALLPIQGKVFENV